MRTEKPWGFEEILHDGAYVVKRIVVRAGQRLSLQYHEHKTETLIIHSGQAVIMLDGTVQQLGPGATIHVPAGTIHRIAAGGETDLELFEASTPELDDVVRLEDDYGRADEDQTGHGELSPVQAKMSRVPDGHA